MTNIWSKDSGLLVDLGISALKDSGLKGGGLFVFIRDLKDFLRQAGEVRFADVVGPGLG